jgi:hypothetical protein
MAIEISLDNVSFISHSEKHESGGPDEISVDGLPGDLADAQDPKQEEVQDIVAALLSAGSNTTLTYDDSNDTLTIDTSASRTDEEIEDVVGALITSTSNTTITYDDPNDQITVDLSENIEVTTATADEFIVNDTA